MNFAEDVSNKTQGPLIERFHKLEILRDLPLQPKYFKSLNSHCGTD